MGNVVGGGGVSSLGQYNVLDYGARSDATGDIGAVVNSLVTGGAKTILLPYVAAGYRQTTGINLDNGVKVIAPSGRVEIKKFFNGDQITSPAKSDYKLEGFKLNGNSGGGFSGNGVYSHISTRGQIIDLEIGGQANVGIQNYQGSGLIVDRLEGTTNGSHMLYFDTHVGANVENVNVNNCGGFGVFGTIGTDRCTFRNLRGTNGTLELITLDGNYNSVDRIWATGCGDNGATCVGDYNEWTNIHSYLNLNNGFAINGSNNSVDQLVCWNNNQRTAGSGTFSGLYILSGFGGFALNNFISNATCYDSNGSPTQNGGCTLGANGYNQWVSGATLPASNYFVYFGANAYSADGGSGVMGASPPVHTSGSVVNGAVTLRYIGSSAVGFHADGNKAVNMRYFGNKTSATAVINNATLGTNTGF